MPARISTRRQSCCVRAHFVRRYINSCHFAGVSFLPPCECYYRHSRHYTPRVPSRSQILNLANTSLRAVTNGPLERHAINVITAGHNYRSIGRHTIADKRPHCSFSESPELRRLDRRLCSRAIQTRFPPRSARRQRSGLMQIACKKKKKKNWTEGRPETRHVLMRCFHERFSTEILCIRKETKTKNRDCSILRTFDEKKRISQSGEAHLFEIIIVVGTDNDNRYQHAHISRQ